MTSRAGAAFGPILGAGVALAAACSTSSGPALGGPHGGNTFAVGPTQGNFAEVDAAYTVPMPATPPGVIPGAVGSWTHIYNAYLIKGTIGDCSNTGCHSKEMQSASTAYQWLEDEGYIGTLPPPLTLQGSCLSWYGGDMPPSKKPSAEAKKEMDGWAQAGAKND
jgi:hypothetical protein